VAEGAAGCNSPAAFGGSLHQRPPSAADIQESLPRLDVQFAKDVIELVQLRLVERFVLNAEIGAGVNHPRVQKLPVKLVRHVVVKLQVAGGSLP